MCYSLEVQLVTALIIIFSSIFYYFYFKHKYRDFGVGWFKGFMAVSMLGALFIGLHQLFEFFTLLTGNIWIYKIGLIISISANYFFLLSLEKLSNKKIYNFLSLIVIIAVSIYILISPMMFSENSFYVQHPSAFFWSAAWLFLLIYWNICAIKIYTEFKDKESKKTILIYAIAMWDLSFILSVFYVIFGHMIYSMNACTDFPSIWCTFAAIQVFVIPFFLYRIGNSFNRNKKESKLPIKQAVIFVLIALGIMLAMALFIPLFDCLTWEFIFP